MYTNSIPSGTPQAAGTQIASTAPAKPAEPQEAETPAQTADQDTYTPSGGKESAGTYAMDVDTVNQMKAELDQMKLRFLDTVKKSLSNQISYGQGAWKNITPEDQAAAQEAISEDGYWGVKQTSQRIVAFGKALVGGDPSRVEEMREAFIKGYKAVEKAWGGALPEVSQKTYDAVMELFDEWAALSAGKEDGGEVEDDPNPQPEAPEEAVESEAAEEEPAAQPAEREQTALNGEKRARQLPSAQAPDKRHALNHLP